MPLYKYVCTACNHEFTELLSMRDPNPNCPQCGKDTEKKMGVSSFTLKGGGWAKDGYGTSSK